MHSLRRATTQSVEPSTPRATDATERYFGAEPIEVTLDTDLAPLPFETFCSDYGGSFRRKRDHFHVDGMILITSRFHFIIRIVRPIQPLARRLGRDATVVS